MWPTRAGTPSRLATIAAVTILTTSAVATPATELLQKGVRSSAPTWGERPTKAGRRRAARRPMRSPTPRSGRRGRSSNRESPGRRARTILCFDSSTTDELRKSDEFRPGCPQIRFRLLSFRTCRFVVRKARCRSATPAGNNRTSAPNAAPTGFRRRSWEVGRSGGPRPTMTSPPSKARGRLRGGR